MVQYAAYLVGMELFVEPKSLLQLAKSLEACDIYEASVLEHVF